MKNLPKNQPLIS